MSTIPTLTRNTDTEVSVTPLDLSSGPHTFTRPAGDVDLIVSNSEGSDITVNLLGASVTTTDAANIGEVDLSAGKDITCADGDVTKINLNNYSAWLGAVGNEVTVTITTASGSSTAFLEVV